MKKSIRKIYTKEQVLEMLGEEGFAPVTKTKIGNIDKKPIDINDDNVIDELIKWQRKEQTANKIKGGFLKYLGKKCNTTEGKTRLELTLNTVTNMYHVKSVQHKEMMAIVRKFQNCMVFATGSDVYGYEYKQGQQPLTIKRPEGKIKYKVVESVSTIKTAFERDKENLTSATHKEEEYTELLNIINAKIEEIQQKQLKLVNAK